MEWRNFGRICAFVCLLAYGSAAPLDQDFGYVDVRPGAHMFWVTYHTELSDDWTQAPLIMWLQGGPGSSGVGYGNFMELGPYDINGNKRPNAWTTKANVMFVDNPVGTGYSWVEPDQLDLLCQNNAEIAADLVSLLTSVFTDYPEMQQMEFFVYAESYGGKMTADFAVALNQAIANGEINCNFKGIAMGDSWISPMDSVNTWGEFLYQMGFVNAQGKARIDNSAASTQSAVDSEDWTKATVRWSATESVVESETNGVNFYNVLAEENIYDSDLSKKKHFPFMKPHIQKLYNIHVRPQAKDELQDFMNGPQKAAWNIPDNVEYDSQGGLVFNHLADDFMKPVISTVEDLLTNSNIHVAVYTGNLDLICDTPGTYRWIENMNYPQKTQFEATDREPLYVTSYSSVAAYVQRYERFSVHTLLRSGHMAPVDAGEMCLNMIDMITAYGEEAVPNTPKSKSVPHPKIHEAKKAVHKETKVATPVKVEKKVLTKPIKVKAPTIKVERQKPSERMIKELFEPNHIHADETERQLKAKVATTRVNKATPLGRRFDRGTVFKPKKVDLGI